LQQRRRCARAVTLWLANSLTKAADVHKT
jgi:hypothetical protein